VDLGQFKSIKKNYMKKILYITGICLLIIIQSFAQTNITSTIQVFPYQKTTEATASLAAMNNWEASEWKAFFKLLDDTAQKTKATYALHAYVNQIANGDKRAAFAKQLLKQKLGFKGYKIGEFGPRQTRRATAANWLLGHLQSHIS